MKGHSSPCACLPYWIKAYLEDGLSNKCVLCHDTFKKKEERGGGSVLIPCGKQIGKQRIHCTTVLFHPGECARLWIDEFHASIQHKLCDYVPMLLDKESKETTDFFRAQCIENHKLIMAFCANFKIQAQEKCRFQTCSGCRNVRYCGAECQTEDWKNHRSQCAPKTKGPVIPMEVVPPKGERCICFTEYETELFNRSLTNQCSNPTCKYIISKDTVLHLSMFVTECSKKLVPMHMIPTKYCSQHCQIHCTQKKNK